jgi:hypothetical protein
MSVRYTIKVETRGGPPVEQNKRYSEFHDLFHALRKHSAIGSFPFPPKVMVCTEGDKKDRLVRFDAFLKIVARHPELIRDLKAQAFFFPPNGSNISGGEGDGCPGSDDGTKATAALGTFKTWLSNEGIRSALMCSAEKQPYYPVGMLDLKIAEVFGLPATDFGVSSDPYCVATLTGYWSHGQEWPPGMRSKFQTKTKSRTLCPEWGVATSFSVPRSGGVLRLEVFDSDTAGSDDLLAFVEVPLEALMSGKATTAWLKLKVSYEYANPLSIRHQHSVRPEDEKEAAAGAEKEASKQKSNKGIMQMFGGKSVNALLGMHAALKVTMRFHYAPWGDALTGLVWQENPYEYVPTRFDIERTLTEVFKTLRLIDPIIQFFNADDLTGLLNNWYWDRKWRSLFWVCFMGKLCAHYPHGIFSFFQVRSYALYGSLLL